MKTSSQRSSTTFCSMSSICVSLMRSLRRSDLKVSYSDTGRTTSSNQANEQVLHERMMCSPFTRTLCLQPLPNHFFLPSQYRASASVWPHFGQAERELYCASGSMNCSTGGRG